MSIDQVETSVLYTKPMAATGRRSLPRARRVGVCLKAIVVEQRGKILDLCAVQSALDRPALGDFGSSIPTDSKTFFDSETAHEIVIHSGNDSGAMAIEHNGPRDDKQG